MDLNFFTVNFRLVAFIFSSFKNLIYFGTVFSKSNQCTVAKEKEENQTNGVILPSTIISGAICYIFLTLPLAALFPKSIEAILKDQNKCFQKHHYFYARIWGQNNINSQINNSAEG